MEVRDLKSEQHAAIEAQLSELLAYCDRPLDGLDRRRFPEMFRRALAAMEAGHLERRFLESTLYVNAKSTYFVWCVLAQQKRAVVRSTLPDPN